MLMKVGERADEGAVEGATDLSKKNPPVINANALEKRINEVSVLFVASLYSPPFFSFRFFPS